MECCKPWETAFSRSAAEGRSRYLVLGHTQLDNYRVEEDGLGRGSTSYLRIYGAVRTAHLERFRVMTPTEVLYTSTRYDFDVKEAGTDLRLRRVGRVGALYALAREAHEIVELTEPLNTQRWVDLAAQIAVLRFGDLLRRRQTRIVSYCIGLTDPVERLRDGRRIPRPVGRLLARTVLRAMVRRTDRLAFGTEAAYQLLAAYLRPDALLSRSRVIPALPAACECPADVQRELGLIAFVGAFTPRKGIGELLAAWELASAGHPDLRLLLVGKGPLAGRVEAWASDRPGVAVSIDPPRADIHRAYRRAHVLVLPSQRSGAWREQVGLPIVEALAHGTEVVTTDETGLARWLASHGHRVVPASAEPDALAAALVAAAGDHRSAATILDTLPAEDGRIAADRWMFATDGPAPRSVEVAPDARELAASYLRAARRSTRLYGIRPARVVARGDRHPIFVVGSPRSGTSFTAGTIGTVPGFADLGELRPLKRSIPSLYGRPHADVVRAVRRIVTVSQRLGMVAGLRVIEQTPESTFLIAAIAEAFPGARFVHMVRDGRDVAASLIGLGWLDDRPSDRTDEVGHPFGVAPRFWVEPQRRDEFSLASTATRAAWVWRRYDSAARTALSTLVDRSLEVRYEDLVADPPALATRLADFVGADGREDFSDAFRHAFTATRRTARGRWVADLSPDQLADVYAEAGSHLTALGYQESTSEHLAD